MKEVEMYEVKALSFVCKICGTSNINEFDKGDTVTRCENCLTTYKIKINAYCEEYA